MAIGVLTLHIHIPGCTSLKEKRSRIKPLLARLHREFNVSAAEMERNDAWKETVLVCAMVSNDRAHAQRMMQKISQWIESSWPDVNLVGDDFEII